MEVSLIYLVLVLLGLCLGSFAGATMWRLRARQLAYDKANGEHVDQGEYEKLYKLSKTSLFSDRSKCLDCSYTLKWYDLIPIISWISIGGKCRKCKKPIGYLEPLFEIGVATFFVLSFAFWPYPLNTGLGIIQFVLWLAAGVGLAILFAYDLLWYLLPDQVSIAVIVIGLLNTLLVIVGATDKAGALFSIIGAITILSGLYWAIYVVSKGKWIGFGDIKLGLGLALLLADWRLAFIALFAANIIGCLIVLPGMALGKLKRDSHVPFGPLLIIGFIIAGLAGNYLINLYMLGLV